MYVNVTVSNKICLSVKKYFKTIPMEYRLVLTIGNEIYLVKLLSLSHSNKG